ncbi:MAG: hypothetical protein KGJ23_08485 [Euryarchaeota archaeon]|nr:hypothetical protein [Euryarchaeota archaeon]MDE1836639.1 hypothetical protein [Euryarchaeota archaeon]MDE1879166.1 hypothetical protein [Euryarchaeota archaeon]MDE2044609.1 hypothetical protein [Thermoplasmata archaeon]
MTFTATRVDHLSQLAPGTWCPVKTSGGKRTAAFCCPNGHKLALTAHAILPTGQAFVTADVVSKETEVGLLIGTVPSVSCPKCEFYDSVVLKGW